MMKRKTTIWLARYGPILIVAAMLFGGYRLYSFPYFWIDDFNNVFWIRNEGFWEIIWHIINPASLFFRPIGMMVYWIMFRTAGLNPFPYHVLTWLVHGVNVVLLFMLLRHVTKSHYLAALIIPLFAFRTTFGDIFWNFANIFQLLAFTLVLLGVLLYIRFGYSVKETLLLAAVYILAIRAEEHAVVLPVIWFAYEWLIRRHGVGERVKSPTLRQFTARYSVFVVIMLWFTFFKISTMEAVDPKMPYYLDLSVLTFGRGYGWYFNSLYHTNLRWGGWFIISALLAVGFAFARNRWALFFMVFTYVTLLPFVFLPNHRWELYWYLPFVGLLGVLATCLRIPYQIGRSLIPRPYLPIILSVVFVGAAAVQFAFEERRGRDGRGYLSDLADEHRSFFNDLRAMVDSRVAVLYYTAIPRHMDESTVLYGTQFGLDRPDIDVKVVETCPAEGLCLEFRDRRLHDISQQPQTR